MLPKFDSHKKCYIFGMIVALIAIVAFVFSYSNRATLALHTQSKHQIAYTLYPASSAFLPDELKRDTLEFLAPRCVRVVRGEWTVDALVLYTEYDCAREPQKLTFCRITDTGEDIIKVSEH